MVDASLRCSIPWQVITSPFKHNDRQLIIISRRAIKVTGSQAQVLWVRSNLVQLLRGNRESPQHHDQLLFAHFCTFGQLVCSLSNLSSTCK